jgi:predicted DNA binding CopG/RHH family protein
MTKIPEFSSEQEEAEFWETHDSTESMDETEPVEVTFVDARRPKKQISLRLEDKTIEQLKAIAENKGIGYQTMIRMWVRERIAEEKAMYEV